MALERKVVFLLVLSLFSVHVASQNAYEYFWFVHQWPPNVCTGCVPRMFTIHGLWPQNFTTPSPVNCPGMYDATKITGPLRTNLNMFWPDVIRGRNEVFWSQEWLKHGTCSSATYDQVGYFRTSLQKRSQVDVQGALAVARITPTNSNWPLANIKNAIRTRTGRQPIIRCDTSTRTKLIEIVICYDKAGTTIINCPLRDRCQPNVLW